MRVVIQRVIDAGVAIDGNKVAQIGRGLLLLVGFEEEDTIQDIEWITRKIANMRIFSDAEGKMNLSVLDVGGEILIVPQFTLHASIKKGNRPSFVRCAKPEVAIPLYETCVQHFEMAVGKEKVQTGEFGADMKVSLVNDGPVTVIVDSKLV